MSKTNQELRQRVEAQGKKLAEQAEVIEKLSQSVESLERKSIGVAPSPTRSPVNYLDFVSMDPRTVADLALPDRLVRDIFAEAHGGARPAGEPAKKVVRGTGYSEPNPLSAPPGIDKVDELCKAQDAQDLAERMRKLGGKG